MRIGYLCAAHIPSRTANSVQTVKTCVALASQGHDLLLIARQPAKTSESIWSLYELPECFELIQIPERGPRGMHTAKFLADAREALHKHKPDIVISRDLFALAAVAGWNVPLIYEAHQLPPYGPVGNLLFSWLLRQPSFARLITVSHALAREFAGIYPKLKTKDVCVVPDAADDIVSQNSPDYADKPWLGRSGAIQVGYIGHLYEGRGIDLILQAADRLPDIDFHIVGGTDHDLSRWLKEGVPPNARFHGYQRPPELPFFYQRCDILIAPYHHKVFSAAKRDIAKFMSPMKIFEYMAAERPIICADLPVLREVLQNGQNAVLFTPGDITEFVAALTRVCADPLLRQRLGKTARANFVERYTWASRADALLAGIESNGQSRS